MPSMNTTPTRPGPTALDLAYQAALDEARQHAQARRFEAALQSLATAHILGQREFARHTVVHWRMLGVAWQRRDPAELSGQLLRLALVPVGHLIGRLPLGNIGLSRVSALAPMPIDPALQRLLDDHAARRRGNKSR
jgi:hypothetical protein